MSDFLHDDVDKLMNEKPPEAKKTDINTLLDEYDRELLSFGNGSTPTRAWPAPIRKRICIK